MVGIIKKLFAKKESIYTINPKGNISYLKFLEQQGKLHAKYSIIFSALYSLLSSKFKLVNNTIMITSKRVNEDKAFSFPVHALLNTSITRGIPFLSLLEKIGKDYHWEGAGYLLITTKKDSIVYVDCISSSQVTTQATTTFLKNNVHYYTVSSIHIKDSYHVDGYTFLPHTVGGTELVFKNKRGQYLIPIIKEMDTEDFSTTGIRKELEELFDIEKNIFEYNTTHLKKGGLPSAIHRIAPDSEFNDKVTSNLAKREGIEQERKANKHKGEPQVVIADDVIQIKTMDMHYPQLLNDVRYQVAVYLNIPIPLLLPKGASDHNMSTAEVDLLQHSVLPLYSTLFYQTIKGILNVKNDVDKHMIYRIAPPVNNETDFTKAYFNLKGVSIIDTLEATVLDAQVKAGVSSINEIRTQAGLSKIHAEPNTKLKYLVDTPIEVQRMMENISSTTLEQRRLNESPNKEPVSSKKGT